MAQKDEAKSPVKKGSGVMKIALIVVGVLILIGGSIGATLFLTGALNKNPEGQTQASSPAAPAAAHGAAPAPAHGAAPANAAAIYQAIDPPFIVNFEDQGVLRYHYSQPPLRLDKTYPLFPGSRSPNLFR